MAIIIGDRFSIYVGTVVLAKRFTVALRIDLVGTDGLISRFRTIQLMANREVADTNITSKQDMQFTRELNTRGIYVLG